MGSNRPTDAAEQIMGEVDLLSNLVYDLNWLAETDSGALRLEMGSHDFGQLLRDEVERWQLQAQVAEIELELQPLPADLPLIQMDATRISQALGNLIENALQHTPQGGRVTIAMPKLDGDSRRSHPFVIPARVSLRKICRISLSVSIVQIRPVKKGPAATAWDWRLSNKSSKLIKGKYGWRANWEQEVVFISVYHYKPGYYSFGM